MSKLVFKKLHSVTNPNSIHGIYPYRGKISALDAHLIIDQLPKTSRLLDPFCGSGTIIYESLCNGLSTIGVDNNPLAIWVCKGKVNSLSYSLDDFIIETKNLIDKAKNTSHYDDMPDYALGHFHEVTASEIMMCIQFIDEMSDYVKACFFGSIALAARGCNQYKWTSSTVGKNIHPKQYISFFDKFLAKVKKHHKKNNALNLSASIHLNDSRNLSSFIEPSSIDYIFTSPPYFNALDYTAYYGKIIYSILGIDRSDIRKGLIQSVNEYERDMKLVLSELIKVSKDDALIIFVVGDKKISKNCTLNGGEFFSKLLDHEPNQIIERSYTNTSSQIFDKLNNTSRKEQIVVWDKGSW